MNEEKPKTKRLGMGESILIVVFALVFDLLSLIPFLNIVVVLVAQGLLALFFFLHGISVFSKKKAVTFTIGTVVELIPFLSMLPALTAQTIAIIILTNIEDKTGLSVPSASVVPKK